MCKNGKQWQTLFPWAPQSLQMVTAAIKLEDTCSLEGKLWQTYVLKSRDITLPTNVRLVKAIVFPVVQYSCERWTIKKAEHQRIDAFELWCWRRLLRIPWRARRFAFLWSACSLLNFYQQWLRVFAVSHSNQIWNLSFKNSGNSNSVIFCFKFLLLWWLMMLSFFFLCAYWSFLFSRLLNSFIYFYYFVF